MTTNTDLRTLINDARAAVDLFQETLDGIAQTQETALEATMGTVTQVGTTNAWTITSVEVAPNDHQAEFSLPVTDRNSLISYVSITTPAMCPPPLCGC